MTAREGLTKLDPDGKVNSYTLLACEYLEQEGQRFLVDFGYRNALTKAREHWASRKRRAKA